MLLVQVMTHLGFSLSMVSLGLTSSRVSVPESLSAERCKSARTFFPRSVLLVRSGDAPGLPDVRRLSSRLTFGVTALALASGSMSSRRTVQLAPHFSGRVVERADFFRGEDARVGVAKSELQNGQRHSFDWSRTSRLLQPENLSRVSGVASSDFGACPTSSRVNMPESLSAERCKSARTFSGEVSAARSSHDVPASWCSPLVESSDFWSDRFSCVRSCIRLHVQSPDSATHSALLRSSRRAS